MELPELTEQANGREGEKWTAELWGAVQYPIHPQRTLPPEMDRS